MPEDTTVKRKDRWFDHPTARAVILWLVGIIQLLLIAGGANLMSNVKSNQEDIEQLKVLMNQQITKVNEALNAHLKDPKIHHAGIQSLQQDLKYISSTLDEIRTEQRAMSHEQAKMKTDIEVIKQKVDDQ